jgi:hypothetical protein
MYAKLWPQILKEGEYMGDEVTDERTVLKWLLER